MLEVENNLPVVIVGEGYKGDEKVAVVSVENIADNRVSVVLNRNEAKIVIERLKEIFGPVV